VSEDEFQQRIVDTASWLGWRVHHTRPARTAKGWRTPVQGHNGFVDLVLARRGVVLMPEIKSAEGSLDPEQRLWRDAIGAQWRLWRPADWPTIEAVLRGAT